MNTAVTVARQRLEIAKFLPEFEVGVQNLLLHKLRSLLTMLGMISGWRRWCP